MHVIYANTLSELCEKEGAIQRKGNNGVHETSTYIKHLEV